jgi:phage gpG-like protein
MASFRQAKKKFDQDLDERINRFVIKTWATIVSETPVDTGRLRSSIIMEQDDDKNWIIGTSVPYAEQIEIGMAPTVIRPKNKKALKFEIGGKTIFAKKVNHPGFKGSHMFLKGVNWAEANMQEFFRK